MSAILPGATIGILGGGQLGRMTALAARELGYRVIVMDPDPECAARGVVDRVVVGSFDDADAAAWLASESAVVTYEIEKIGPSALTAVQAHAPLRPAPRLLGIVQDRAAQKRWLSDQGFPIGSWREAGSPEELSIAAAALGRCRAKSRHGGYDGRRQHRFSAAMTSAEIARAWEAVGAAACVVEAELDLEAELSVMVARRPSGESVVYPPPQNWHRDGILDLSVLPGELPERAVAEAKRQTLAMAEAFGLEGLLAVEWFLTRDGRVLVNEMAPRPHNTFHATDAACVTSQFEQLVRAVCDLPLGSTDITRPTALLNLLGDLWLKDAPPPIEQVLAIPGLRLHLYGKAPRPGRKVGHLLAVAETPALALERVRAAREILGVR